MIMRNQINAAAYVLASLIILSVPIVAYASSEADMKIVNPTNTPIAAAVAVQTGDQMILTAFPTDSQVKPGQKIGVIVTAHRPNGTAIDNASVRTLIMSYVNNTDKTNLNSKTDKTGDTTFTFKVGKGVKTGQWAVDVSAAKDGFRPTEVQTGFAVTEFSGHDSGKSHSSDGKCSGSSCK